jgi:hypothetical protein
MATEVSPQRCQCGERRIGTVRDDEFPADAGDCVAGAGANLTRKPQLLG